MNDVFINDACGLTACAAWETSLTYVTHMTPSFGNNRDCVRLCGRSSFVELIRQSLQALVDLDYV